MTTGKVALESVGLRDMPECLIRELYTASGPLYAESAPGEPRLPVEQRLAFARNVPEAYGGVTVVARDATGRIAGSADVTARDVDGFRHIAQVGIGVLPGDRRAGIGRALLGGVLEAAERFDRGLLLGAT
ncbi:MAG: GNAT family N-acetyltransferase, partial [Trebonia sp.]